MGQGQLNKCVRGATMDIHVDLSIREEIESGPEVVEEGRRDINPNTSDSVQRKSGGWVIGRTGK